VSDASRQPRNQAALPTGYDRANPPKPKESQPTSLIDRVLGHALIVDEPERFNSLLEDFISGFAF
jgi:hypothetical protein